MIFHRPCHLVALNFTIDFFSSQKQIFIYLFFISSIILHSVSRCLSNYGCELRVTLGILAFLHYTLVDYRSKNKALLLSSFDRPRPLTPQKIKNQTPLSNDSFVWLSAQQVVRLPTWRISVATVKGDGCDLKSAGTIEISWTAKKSFYFSVTLVAKESRRSTKAAFVSNVPKTSAFR